MIENIETFVLESPAIVALLTISLILGYHYQKGLTYTDKQQIIRWCRCMSDWESETCAECGYTDPVANDNVFQTYNGEMLCSMCRVYKRLEDNDFSNE